MSSPSFPSSASLGTIPLRWRGDTQSQLSWVFSQQIRTTEHATFYAWCLQSQEVRTTGRTSQGKEGAAQVVWDQLEATPLPQGKRETR